MNSPAGSQGSTQDSVNTINPTNVCTQTSVTVLTLSVLTHSNRANSPKEVPPEELPFVLLLKTPLA